MPVLNIIFIANKTDQFTTQTHLHITSTANDWQATFVGIEITITSGLQYLLRFGKKRAWQWGNEIAIRATATAVSIWLCHSCTNFGNEISNGLFHLKFGRRCKFRAQIENAIASTILPRIYCSLTDALETEIRIHIPYTNTHKCSFYLHCSSAAPHCT